MHSAALSSSFISFFFFDLSRGHSLAGPADTRWKYAQHNHGRDSSVGCFSRGPTSARPVWTWTTNQQGVVSTKESSDSGDTRERRVRLVGPLCVLSNELLELRDERTYCSGGPRTVENEEIKMYSRR